LGNAQAQVEKKNREDRVVKSGIEKDSEKDESAPIAVRVCSRFLLGVLRAGQVVM
jgi:hypothetical protein